MRAAADFKTVAQKRMNQVIKVKDYELKKLLRIIFSPRTEYKKKLVLVYNCERERRETS
jgi:hypothetical protein